MSNEELSNSNPTVVPFSPERRGINDPEAFSDLENFGFCVFKEVASESQLEDLHSKFWNFIEKFNPQISRSDSKTWNNNWPDIADKGMITAPFVAHADFMWQAREICLPVYEKLWGTSDLLTSFDRCNAFRPPSVDPKWKTTGGWYHVDQNGDNKKGLHCYQGFLDCFGSTGEDGGVVVVPKSHLIFDDMFTIDKLANGKKNDFCILPPPLIQKYVVNPLKICLEAGDMFIWDGRVIHCSAPSQRLKAPKKGINHLDRLVFYVSMSPKSKATNEVLEKKKNAVLNTGDATSHWAHEHAVTGREAVCEGPWIYESPTLTKVQKQLGGLE
eukprot:c19064_g1_i1.p1 GENE.c19064_g1_i1~~c19064_g1_i1.p1  ORF type:complete len:358 (-),score=168.44 c19064_g1_i1:54-1037(-)